MRSPRTSLALRTAAIALGVACALAALPCEARPVREEFIYRWQLGRFVGRLAGLFFPGRGEGRLTYEPQDGILATELFITSGEAETGEYFRYGSEIDADSLDARRAWASYRWRGETKSKSAEIHRTGVKDVVAGIYAIRRDPPEAPRSMAIWSDGKIYPVIVIPHGPEMRRVAERDLATRRYSVEGYDTPGGRRWKGRLQLWLADDEAATPVAIVIERGFADLRLELVAPL